MVDVPSVVADSRNACSSPLSLLLIISRVPRLSVTSEAPTPAPAALIAAPTCSSVAPGAMLIVTAGRSGSGAKPPTAEPSSIVKLPPPITLLASGSADDTMVWCEASCSTRTEKLPLSAPVAALMPTA